MEKREGCEGRREPRRAVRDSSAAGPGGWVRHRQRTTRKTAWAGREVQGPKEESYSH